MCTTYYIQIEESELREICREIEENQQIRMQSGKVYPKYVTPVLVMESDAIKPRAMNWGFPAQWGKTNKTLVNTRIETALEKKTWRNSILHRRLLIPMTGFYEWKTEVDDTKKLYYFQNANGGLLYAAGIYNYFEPEGKLLGERFSMITTEPSNTVKAIHDRMPLIVSEDEKQQWLTNGAANMARKAANQNLIYSQVK